MRKSVFLLIGIIALYLFTGAILHAVYGPSYPVLPSENSWQPDGQGGWVARGNPAGPPPVETSVEVPLLAQYLPIFIPGLLLILVLFTPVGRVLEGRRAEQTEPSETGHPPDSDAEKR